MEENEMKEMLQSIECTLKRIEILMLKDKKRRKKQRKREEIKSRYGYAFSGSGTEKTAQITYT